MQLGENNTRHICTLSDLEAAAHISEECKLDGQHSRSVNKRKAVTGLKKARIADMHSWAHRAFDFIITARDSVARVESRHILVAESREKRARTAGRDGAVVFG